MDVLTRRVWRWEVGRSLDQGDTPATLIRAILGGRRPEFHHSNSMVRYAVRASTDRLAGHAMAFIKAAVGKPEENG